MDPNDNKYDKDVKDDKDDKDNKDDILVNMGNPKVIYKYKGNGGKIIGYFESETFESETSNLVYPTLVHPTLRETLGESKKLYVFNLLGTKTELKITNKSSNLLSDSLGIEECKDCKLEPKKLNIEPGTKIVYKYPMKGWVSKIIFDQGSEQSEQYKNYDNYNKYMCNEFINNNIKKIAYLNNKKKQKNAFNTIKNFFHKKDKTQDQDIKDIANNGDIIYLNDPSDIKEKIEELEWQNKEISDNINKINNKYIEEALHNFNKNNRDVNTENMKYYTTQIYTTNMATDIQDFLGNDDSKKKYISHIRKFKNYYCASIIDLIDKFQRKFKPGAIFTYDGIDERGLLVKLLVEEQSTDASKSHNTEDNDKEFLFPSSAFYSPFFEIKSDESEIDAIKITFNKEQPPNGGKRNLSKSKKTKKSKKSKKTKKSKKSKKTKKTKKSKKHQYK